MFGECARATRDSFVSLVPQITAMDEQRQPPHCFVHPTHLRLLTT